jgi:hypothetical protein
MNCEQVREWLEAYGLGALDADERIRVEHHLAACPACQRLAQEYVATANLLPQALAALAPALSPPPALRERLLQQVATAPPEAKTVNPAATTTRPVEQESFSNRPAGLAPAGVPAGFRWSRSSWIIAGSALLLLVLTAVTLGTRLNIVVAQERALRAELANLFDQQEVVLEVIDSNQTVRHLLLAPEPRLPSARPPYGKLFTRLDLPHVVAMVARLPQPPPGQAYHLWLTRQGRTELAGVLTVNEQGFGLLVFDADRNGPSYEAALLTLQTSGDTAPAGETVLVWQPAGP